MMYSFTTFVGQYVVIIVVAGFPWKLPMRILSECGLTLAKESYALGLSISPTPPTAAPAEFLIADVVTSVLPSTLSYLTGSACTIRCSCTPSISMLHVVKLAANSSLFLSSLIVLTFIVDTIAVFLQLSNDLPFQTPLSGLPLPCGFEGKSPCESKESVSVPGQVKLGTLTLALFRCAIIVFLLQYYPLITVFSNFYRFQYRSFPSQWDVISHKQGGNPCWFISGFPSLPRAPVRYSGRKAWGIQPAPAWSKLQAHVEVGVELQAERRLWTSGLMELPPVHTAGKGRMKVGWRGKGKPCKGSMQVWNESGEMRTRKASWRCASTMLYRHTILHGIYKAP